MSSCTARAIPGTSATAPRLETLARICPNFTYIPSITRPTDDPYFEGEIGRIQTLLERQVIEEHSGLTLDPAQIDLFLCGNPDMIVGTSAWLRAERVHRGSARRQGDDPLGEVLVTCAHE